jgi:hypothetical protein
MALKVVTLCPLKCYGHSILTAGISETGRMGLTPTVTIDTVGYVFRPDTVIAVAVSYHALGGSYVRRLISRNKYTEGPVYGVLFFGGVT